MYKERAEYYDRRLPKKGIRRDLYNRTPRLELDIKNLEMIRCCEKYFEHYICRYKKIKKLRTIEYVTLGKQGKKYWYRRAANYMEGVIAGSICLTIINMVNSMSFTHLKVIMYIIVYKILIKLLKTINAEFLQSIAIRYFYDAWGYYLTSESSDKYVGTVQMVERSRYHKFIHSFLDIVALCRAVSVDDKLNKGNRICIITNNLNDLFLGYSDFEKEQNWIMLIPLWIAALFEFNVTGKVEERIKATLVSSVNENVRANISNFLQSFWVDMERKELNKEMVDYICLFQKELCWTKI